MKFIGKLNKLNLVKQNLKSNFKLLRFQFPNLKNFADETNKSNETFSGIHSDFQKKVKVEITDENVMQIIDEYVKNNDVCVFIKGTKEMPRCGFSNYLIQILQFYKIAQYKDVNVLESEVLRNSIKKYSNWPTFPQLYIKGQLVGGCDIMKEMHENGNFEELLKANNIITNI